MEPVYQYKAETPSFKILIFVSGIMFIAMAVWVPFEGNEPLWIQWALRIFLFLMGILVFAALPTVSLKAFPEYLEIRYGLTNLGRFTLDNSKITAIDAIEYNPLKEFGGAGIKGGTGRWKGWIAFTADMKTHALSIETTEKNYLLSCPDPDEAQTMLRNIAGLK